MDEETIYLKLAEVFRDVFDEPVALTPELSAKDVAGWDSLTHVRLMLTVERTFGVKFSTTEIGKLRNVEDLVNLIANRA